MTNLTKTLDVDDVIKIHETLVQDFIDSNDPISPPGIRGDGDLLESAVARQHVGFGNDLKYPTAIKNAATLAYGVTSNHPFHNGNKRAALVALLCHMDRNGFTFLNTVTQDDLYKFMKRIASHYFAPKKSGTDKSDYEVEQIALWVSKRVRTIKKGERVVTFRELEVILKNYDIYFENKNNNYVDVIKYEEKRKFLFGKKQKMGIRVAHIPYPRAGMEVGKSILKSLREKCELTEKDGYDSEMFYSSETSIDKFIVQYRKTLNKLAKT